MTVWASSFFYIFLPYFRCYFFRIYLSLHCSGYFILSFSLFSIFYGYFKFFFSSFSLFLVSIAYHQCSSNTCAYTYSYSARINRRRNFSWENQRRNKKISNQQDCDHSRQATTQKTRNYYSVFILHHHALVHWCAGGSNKRSVTLHLLLTMQNIQ